jgi:hypothetical protein
MTCTNLPTKCDSLSGSTETDLEANTNQNNNHWCVYNFTWNGAKVRMLAEFMNL